MPTSQRQPSFGCHQLTANELDVPCFSLVARCSGCAGRKLRCYWQSRQRINQRHSVSVSTQHLNAAKSRFDMQGGSCSQDIVFREFTPKRSNASTTKSRSNEPTRFCKNHLPVKKPVSVVEPDPSRSFIVPHQTGGTVFNRPMIADLVATSESVALYSVSASDDCSSTASVEQQILTQRICQIVDTVRAQVEST